jgi:hypothetical protein
MILRSVFVLSAASLAFEVLLTRLFSIAQFNHLSFVVVAVAMLGTAASGLVATMRPPGPAGSTSRAIVLFPVVLLAAFEAAVWTRLDYFRLAVDATQLLRLAALFAALACPFVLAGLVTARAYVRVNAGKVYLASMGGSAIGALAPAVLLPALGLARSFALVALAAAVVAALDAPAVQSRRERRFGLWLQGGVLAVAAFVMWWPDLSGLGPNEYKAFSQLTQVPGVTVTARREDLRARYDELSGDPIRYAPGLSLRYTDALPREQLILEDGDGRHVLVTPGDPLLAPFTRSLLSFGATAAPARCERVLVLHADGGLAPAVARAAGARTVDLVTDQRYLARRFGEHYGSFLSSVTYASPRSFLAQPHEPYDLVVVESWGAQIPAMASLTEDHWLTVQGLRAMLAALAPGGAVALNRALDVPPTDFSRLLSTAWRALNTPNPVAHTAALRSWDSLLLLVYRDPLTPDSVDRLKAFAARLRFDPVLLPGLTAAEANRFNQMARPYHFEAARELAAGIHDPRSPFDVSAVTDASPFPYHMVRWTRLPAAWRLLHERLYSLLLSGEAMLVLVLATTLLAAAAILAVPALAGRARALAAAPAATGRGPGPGPPAATFIATGAGYILCEIAWLHSLGLLFDSPSLAFAAGVGGLLLASGPAGLVAERTRRLGAWLLAAALGCAALAGGLAAAAPALLALAPLPRAALALAALVGCGFLLGVPFPLAMRRSADAPRRQAYAWAANGAASVVAAAAAPFVAMSWGTPVLFACASACYAAAIVALSSTAAARHAGGAASPTGGGP